MKKGKVWLVGAGPGDIGLMTLKGYDLLKKAEVVVYDSLVSDAILAWIPENAKKIDAGKRAGNHKLRQEETNRILLEEAQQGKRVVRLKGGDPFLFGRGGEELELLTENEIPYEVVPGITSAIAVPAYNGVPVTHRDYCSSIHVITGHKKQGEEYDIDFEALVRTKGTLIFLMGISAIEDICNQLMRAGMNPDMPAAVFQEGTTAGQRKVVATVATITQRAREEKIGTPGIIVVGKVCELAYRFDWVEKQPLFGYKVLITRPRELASTMAEKLRELGAEVVEMPSIKAVAIEKNEALRGALEHLPSYQWIAFTSPTGVRIFWEEVSKARVDMRAFSHIRFAVLGTGTQKELGKKGIFADLIPEVSDGKALGEAIARVANPGDRILIPRAAKGNMELIEALKDFTVDDLAIYETVACERGVMDIAGEIEAGKIHCAAFTSSSAVRSFVEGNPTIDYSRLTAACIGQQTMDTAREYGMRCVMAKKATIDSLIDTVIALKNEKG